MPIAKTRKTKHKMKKYREGIVNEQAAIICAKMLKTGVKGLMVELPKEYANEIKFLDDEMIEAEGEWFTFRYIFYKRKHILLVQWSLDVFENEIRRELEKLEKGAE